MHNIKSPSIGIQIPRKLENARRMHKPNVSTFKRENTIDVYLQEDTKAEAQEVNYLLLFVFGFSAISWIIYYTFFCN